MGVTVFPLWPASPRPRASASSSVEWAAWAGCSWLGWEWAGNRGRGGRWGRGGAQHIRTLHPVPLTTLGPKPQPPTPLLTA